jgi:streptogramin lyase
VCRYDGYDFTTYTTRKGLPDNCIFQITEDHRGRKWLRSFNGNVAYIENNKIVTLECNDEIIKWLDRGYLKSLYVDKGDTLWLTAISTDNYLKILPGYHDHEVMRINSPGPEQFIKELPNKGYIWGFQNLEQPRVINQDTRIFWNDGSTTLIKDTFQKGYSRNSFCLRLPDGKFLFALNHELFLADKTGLLLNRKFDNNIIALNQTQDGYIWVGFMHGGVMRFDNSGSLAAAPSKTYLAQKSVSWSLMDNEGAMWFSTLDDGVFYLQPGQMEEYGQQNGLSDKKVNAVLMSGNKIWAGLDNGVLAELDRSTGQLREHTFDLYTGALSINGLHTMKDQVGVSSTYGYIAFSPSTYKKTLVTPYMGRAACTGKDGNPWVATVNHIYRLDMTTGEKLDSIDMKQRVMELYEDRSGKLWIGTLSGLWCYAADSLSRFRPADPLLNAKITDINETNDGTLWIATAGQGMLSVKNGSMKQWSTDNGLSSDMCRALYVDKRQNIWIATNKGITMISSSVKGKRIIKYSSKNGLGSDDVRSITGMGDTICMGTSEGMVYFTNLWTNKQPPPLHLNSITVGKRTIAAVEKLSIPVSENTIELSYTALSYQSPGNITYRYVMLGLDNAWNQTNATTIKYQSLPSGSYHLLLYALNPDGYPSQLHSIAITVEPPFYRSWWFYIAAFFTVPGAMALTFRRRVSILNRKAIKRAALNKQIAQMELKALKAQMNPHFIFNAINAIQYFIIKKDCDTAQVYLTKFSRLVRNVLENSEQQLITLDKEIQTLRLYLEIEKLRYGERLDYEVHVEGKIDGNERIAPMLVQPYVENAIRHGISPLPTGGKVTIIFSIEIKLLRITIADNGIGRKASMQANIQSMHTSMGMKVTSTRIRMLNEEYGKSDKYTLIISDIIVNQKVKGTQVELLVSL